MKPLRAIFLLLCMLLMVVLPHAHMLEHHAAPTAKCGHTCSSHHTPTDETPVDSPSAPYGHNSCKLCELLMMPADTPYVVMLARPLSRSVIMPQQHVATHIFLFSPFTEARAPPAATENA
jgi:hypothetical protein